MKRRLALYVLSLIVALASLTIPGEAAQKRTTKGRSKVSKSTSAKNLSRAKSASSRKRVASAVRTKKRSRSRVSKRSRYIPERVATGALIEPLKGGEPVLSQNPDEMFNPASVAKLATSLLALDLLGPSRCFKTEFFSHGSVDQSSKTLNGDLIVVSEGDPMLDALTVSDIARQLVASGIHRVSGNLIVSGPLVFSRNSNPESAAKLLARALARPFPTPVASNRDAQSSLEISEGIVIEGLIKTGVKPEGALLVASHQSPTLLEILRYQNVHSDNYIAEVIGSRIGGPRAVEQFLVEKAGLPDEKILLSSCSGLGYNRISPRAAVNLVRYAVDHLGQKNLTLESILPVSGEAEGTLRRRFSSLPQGTRIVAKTGTLLSSDGGASALVGIAYPPNGEPLVFAILNRGRQIGRFRSVQDQVLASVASGNDASVVLASLNVKPAPRASYKKQLTKKSKSRSTRARRLRRSI